MIQMIHSLALIVCGFLSFHTTEQPNHHMKDSGHHSEKVRTLQTILNISSTCSINFYYTSNSLKLTQVNLPSSHSKLPTFPRSPSFPIWLNLQHQSPRCKAVVVAARKPDQLETSGTGSYNKSSKALTYKIHRRQQNLRGKPMWKRGHKRNPIFITVNLLVFLSNENL